MSEKTPHRGPQRPTESPQAQLSHTPRIITPADGGPDLSELQPCPQCGARPQLYGDLQTWTNNPRFKAQCPQCGCRGQAGVAGIDPFGRKRTAEQAITMAADNWNAGNLYSAEETARQFAAWGKT